MDNFFVAYLYQFVAIMKVVFAGYSKCGTKSMAAAFRELGLKVYDFMEQYEECGDQFKEICLKGGTKEDFQKMLKDVDAVTDVPAYFFWEEILEAFPEAKVFFNFILKLFGLKTNFEGDILST